MSSRVYIKGSFSEKEALELDSLIANGWARSRSDLVRIATREYVARKQI